MDLTSYQVPIDPVDFHFFFRSIYKQIRLIFNFKLKHLNLLFNSNRFEQLGLVISSDSWIPCETFYNQFDKLTKQIRLVSKQILVAKHKEVQINF